MRCNNCKKSIMTPKVSEKEGRAHKHYFWVCRKCGLVTESRIADKVLCTAKLDIVRLFLHGYNLLKEGG